MAKIIWKSKQQIEEESLLQLLIPSKDEIEKAEREIEVIKLLLELELI